MRRSAVPSRGMAAAQPQPVSFIQASRARRRNENVRWTFEYRTGAKPRKARPEGRRRLECRHGGKIAMPVRR